MDKHLVDVAQRILTGAELPEVDFSRDFLPLDALDDRMEAELENGLWLACRRFQDDADIRGREVEYDQAQRDAVRLHLNAYMKATGQNR